jgi:hypothetical protein
MRSVCVANVQGATPFSGPHPELATGWADPLRMKRRAGKGAKRGARRYAVIETRNGGHAALCPPYITFLIGGRAATVSKDGHALVGWFSN